MMDSMLHSKVRGHSRGYFIFSLIFIMLISGSAWIGYDRLQQMLFSDNTMPVRRVIVDGALSELSQNDIVSIAGKVAGGRNIASLESEKLEQAIMRLPWAARAKVVKKLPDTLVISVLEHVPAAYWKDKGLYDAKMHQIFYPDLNNFAEPLVRLGAPDDARAPEVYAGAAAFIRALQNTPFYINEVWLDDINSWKVQLVGGVWLYVGRSMPGHLSPAERLKRFAAAFPLSGLDLKDLTYIDLRYDSGFAVGKRKSDPDPAAAADTMNAML